MTQTEPVFARGLILMKYGRNYEVTATWYVPVLKVHFTSHVRQVHHVVNFHLPGNCSVPKFKFLQ